MPPPGPSPERELLSAARLLAAIGVASYSLVGVALHQAGARDHILPRVVVTGYLAALLVGTQVSPLVRAHLRPLLLSGVYAITAHGGLALIWNDLAPTLVIVTLTILAGFTATATVTISRERQLVHYMLFAGATSLAAVLLVPEPRISPALFLLTQAVVLALAFTAVRGHLRTLEHLRRSEEHLRDDVACRQASELLLRRSEERATALLDALPDVLVRLGRDGVALGVRNDEATALGSLLREGVGEPLDTRLDTVEPCSVAASVEQVLVSGQVITLTATVAGGGRARHVELRVARKSDDECLALVRDVTQEQEVEARLRVAERLASLGTLAGGVAHEINNPLSYVSANADYVLECLDRIPTDELARCDADDAKQALSELQEGARRIASIVQGLKSQTREDDMTLAPTDPNEAVEAALRILDNQIKYRSRIELALGDVPRVLGRPQHLVQVVVNLVANALDAFPARPSDRNVVRIETRLSDGTVVLEVKDNGVGIPESVKHRIFDPFFTTKPPNVGTGLGLYLSHQYLSAASATIDVESEEGAGTRFEIRLTPAEGQEALVVPPASSGRLPTSRILVVDDEPLVARSLSRMLRGHELVLAGDGEAALWECLSRAFDLILCDMMMPRLDGMGFHAALLEHRPALARRIVFMTGGTFTPATRDFLNEVPNALVEKPIQAARLFEAARRQMASSSDESTLARTA